MNKYITLSYLIDRVLSAFIKSFIFTVERSMKLAENMYFGIRIVISNGATKKNMQGGVKSAKLKEGPEPSVYYFWN